MKKQKSRKPQGFSPEELNRPVAYHYHSFVKLRTVIEEHSVPVDSRWVNTFIFNNGCSDRPRKERDLAIARISTYNDDFTMENPDRVKYTKMDILKEIYENGKYAQWFILAELNTVYEILIKVRNLQQGCNGEDN